MILTQSCFKFYVNKNLKDAIKIHNKLKKFEEYRINKIKAKLEKNHIEIDESFQNSLLEISKFANFDIFKDLEAIPQDFICFDSPIDN